MENKLEDIEEKSVELKTKVTDFTDKPEVVKTRGDDAVNKPEEQDNKGGDIKSKTEKHCEATADLAPQETSLKCNKFNYLNTTIAKSASVPSLECKTLHKVRHYDPQAARDYIKLQKERRKQVLQHQQKESVQLAIDIKKQRLKKLQQKSLDLVIKSNKRRRSRSEGERVAQESVHNDNDNEVDVKKNAVVPSDRVAQNLPSQRLCDKVTVRLRCNGEGDVPKLEVPEGWLSKHSEEESWIPEGRNSNISIEDKSQSKIPHSNGIDNIPSVLSNHSNRDGMSQVTIRPHYAEVTDGELQIPPETKLYEILKDKLALQVRSESKPKAVRTEPEFPSWLDAPSIDPYTCNFISAVRKKLQLSLNDKSHQNVSVQANPIIADTPKRTRSLEEAKRDIKDILEKSDSQKNTELKSFVSHKCRELKLSERSDSDTSKNIPDISTESGTGIDTKPINDLRLVLPRRRKLEFENPKRVEISEIIASGSNQSRSKSRSLEDKSKSKSRFLSGDDTIISSNKCEYSEDVVSVSTKTVPEDLPSPAGSETVNLNSQKHLIARTQPVCSDTITIPSSDDIDNDNIKTINSVPSSNDAQKCDVVQVNGIHSKNGDIISVKSSEANDYASDFTSATTSSLSSVPSLKIPSVSLKPEMKTSFFQTKVVRFCHCKHYRSTKFML